MNVLNHTQFNGAYAGGLGNTNVTNNPAQRPVPGHRQRRPTSAPADWRTYNPRQIQFRATFRF